MSATTTALDDAQPNDEKEPAPATVTFKRKMRHLGFLPIPQCLQYDPARPFEYSTLLVGIFGFASTMTVSNLYYAQPLLIQLAKSFGVSNTQVTNVPTLIRDRYLAHITLGRPRPKTTAPVLAVLLLIVASLGLARAPSLPAFTALSFLVEVSAVTPQILFY